MHDVTTRSHPVMRNGLDLEMLDALGWHQGAPGHAAGEARLLRTEDEAAHARMDAVGTDQEVRFRRRAIVEPRDHALAVLIEGDELVADMQTLLRQRLGQKADKVAAMEVVVRRAEGRLDLGSDRGELQRASIVPAP